MKINLMLKGGLNNSLSIDDKKTVLVKPEKKLHVFVLKLVQRQIKSLQHCEQKLMDYLHD